VAASEAVDRRVDEPGIAYDLNPEDLYFGRSLVGAERPSSGGVLALIAG
jgi:hypothetical protein